MTTPTMADLLAEGQELLDTMKGGAIATMLDDFAALQSKLSLAINAANDVIPTAIEDFLYQEIYLDPVNGNDLNSGTSGERLKTMKAAVSKATRLGKTKIHVMNDLPIDEMIDVVDKYIEINLNGYTIEQLTSGFGVIGCFRMMGESWIQMSNGYAKTALLDANVDTSSINTALFRRQDLYRTRVYIFSVHTELGDHAFMSVAAATGMHELGIGYSNLTFRTGATVHKFLQLTASTMSLSMTSVTKPSEFSWSELIDGIVRDLDGTPKNIISNMAV